MKTNVDGVDSLLARLNKIASVVDNNKNNYNILQIVKSGYVVAENSFEKAKRYGDNDIRLDISLPYNGESELIASGKDVTFVEFGTGVFYNSSRNYPLADKLGFDIGGYGYHLGKLQHWHYVNEMGETIDTYGNPPAFAMYDAAKEMRNFTRKLFKEVYGK